MPKKIISKWGGGISANSKSGLTGSARFLKHLAIYPDDDSVTLNPQPVKVSGSIVTDLVKWMTEATPYSTDKYAIGDTGNIYKITSNDTFTLDRSGATIGNSGAGQGLLVVDNFLWYTTSSKLGRKGILSGTPSYTDDYVTTALSTTDQSGGATTNSYSLTSAITETAVNQRAFTPAYDPLKSIIIYPKTAGTGNWTITVHDSVNNVIGTITVSNANITINQNNTFTFSSPLRVRIGDTYHFHVTSSDGTGTLGTTTTSSLADCLYQTNFEPLVTDANYHPLIRHTNGTGWTLLVGNEHYIAQLTRAGAYNPNQITLEPGYNVRYFVKENEFVVAMCWKGTDITASEEGIAFYWDGISPYYNYAKPITGGLPNASVNFKNRIFSVLGNNGIMTLGTEPFKTIQPIPKLDLTKSIEVLPGAITVWQNRVHIGVGANSTDGTNVIQGVYEFGNQSDRAITYTSVSTEVLNFGYTISTGDETGTTMKIGCVKSFGSSMYISWKSQAGTYGVDKVSETGSPASTGSYESLIDDDAVDAQGNFYSAPQKEKLAQRLVFYFPALPTGCTITPKYKIDRAASWTLGTAEQVGGAGDTICKMQINKRYHEIEYGFDVTATTNYPVISGGYFEMDGLLSERDDN